VTLSAWECGSHLYGPQKFEVYLYPTRSEHEAKKMARTNQRLRIGSALSPGNGECGCGRIESQGSLQLLASCTFLGRGIYHLSITGIISVQHYSHAYLEE
jgi:hypothetical protein